MSDSTDTVRVRDRQRTGGSVVVSCKTGVLSVQSTVIGVVLTYIIPIERVSFGVYNFDIYDPQKKVRHL